ncbi:MAG: NUDIX domain-containing protein [Armatimonadetes bacterium]|nr:NUDIX domain-containing protein [Armatimonadota bacterium]
MEPGAPRAIPVVTAFLYRRGKVLLLRRSERVKTYRGRWAGVSGYLERPPLPQVRRELYEELSLSADQVDLRGLGLPLAVNDPAAGHQWVVFPFLFRLHQGADTRTDWESAKTVWVRPEAVADYDTVPGLEEALSHVWPPSGGSRFWWDMETIATDTIHGATALADSALRAVGRVRGESRLRAIRAMASLHPSMGIFPHLAARLLVGDATPGGLRREIEEAGKAASEHAASALRACERVLTHSASSACRRTLLSWWKEGREVVVTESRPQREGIALARDLATHGVHVTVISDAEMGLFIPGCDAVLMGVDAIGAGEEVVNKVGTRLAVMAARESSVPAYAVAQSHKICPPGWPLTLTPQEPSDLARVSNARVENIAFDSTPLSWFSAVYTEEGRLTRASLRRIRRQLRIEC